MAVLRLAVRESKVCCWLIRHKAATGRFVMTGGQGRNVTWTWDGTTVSAAGTDSYGGSVSMEMLRYPTWEEIRKLLGPDQLAGDWILSRYRKRD